MTTDAPPPRRSGADRWSRRTLRGTGKMALAALAAVWFVGSFVMVWFAVVMVATRCASD